MNETFWAMTDPALAWMNIGSALSSRQKASFTGEREDLQFKPVVQ